MVLAPLQLPQVQSAHHAPDATTAQVFAQSNA
jgi:hypothetical protein